MRVRAKATARHPDLQLCVLLMHLSFINCGESRCPNCIVQSGLIHSLDIQIVTALQLPQVPGIGEQVVLSCNVTGTPLPTTTWFKDGEILTSSDKTYILNDDGLAKLIVNDAVEGDSGEYVCVSTNAAGSARNTFEVDVTRGIYALCVGFSLLIVPCTATLGTTQSVLITGVHMWPHLRSMLSESRVDLESLWRRG